MPFKHWFSGFFCIALCLWPGGRSAWAESGTVMLTGMRGLNVIPTARMDEPGTVRAGISTLDPYMHGYIGFQLAAPLYINIRQSAEVSGLNTDPDRLYPGIDAKLRLLQEDRLHPEIAVGLQSALGHKRMAAEYIVASKRWKDFDFTAGLAWGRMGSAGHLPNPLKKISHFNDREPDGEMPSGISNWFTGQDIGVFGGVEYFTPVKGLSVKFDWNADRYEAENTALGFDAPPPWSAGLAYKPFNWLDLGIAVQGTDKIMGRIALSTALQDWKKKEPEKAALPLNPKRSSEVLPGKMETAAAADGIILSSIQTSPQEARAMLALRPEDSSPAQIGRAAIHMANNAGRQTERISITPVMLGLRGPTVELLRTDLERALTHSSGSAEETWRHAEFDVSSPGHFQKMKRPAQTWYGLSDFHFTLEEQTSLSEEDSGILTRTSFLAGARGPSLFALLDTGYSLRANLHNNLGKLNELRFPSPLPVRGNVDAFASRRIALDRLYTTFTHSFSPELHLAVTGGYLEEMYAGLGGEILYRPFGSRFAVGAEIWEALKREPSTPLNTGFNGDHLLTGHVNAWYDIPKMDLTFNARLGRYLAEDLGGTFALQKNFKNGAHLEGFITATDLADPDPFGGTTHIHHGIRLALPLGGFKYMPRGAGISFKAEPFGRDSGQPLENPVPLYALTEPFSKQHMARQWEEVLPAQ
ncbi:MAG: YjbH domain-containing protein [Alphaproteobacteria bacterium]|nr:YjbH domain-containing protein [Alphaproteobacteria bacterium]